MLRILVLILILLPTISNADQGLNILCLNLKSILDKKYETLKFNLEAVGLQYFDKEKNKFIMIESNKLQIGENSFTARFLNHELGFQMVLFKDDKEPTMTMSKYDCKSKKFLEHYTCDAKLGYIE